jgi:hypothetical protein
MSVMVDALVSPEASGRAASVAGVSKAAIITTMMGRTT